LGVTSLRGKSYPYGETFVVPTFHPAYALRGGAVIVAEMRADFVRAKRLLA
jgi:uracil-DNA glycosylase